MQLLVARSAKAVVFGTLARHIKPSPPIAPSAWAAENVVLPDGEYAGERIDLTRTPHISEPLDLLGPDSPHNEIAVMKSGQTAFTTMLLCLIGHSIDRDPCDMVVVQPTDAALTKTEAKRLAVMAHDGMGRALRPTHAAMDGDTVFAAATGASAREPTLRDKAEIGACAADCLARAIARAVYEAKALPFAGALPSWRDRFAARAKDP